MIVVAAILRIVEGKEEEFEQEFAKLAPKVRNDFGTISYTLHRSINDPTKYFVYEKYQSDEALKRHPSMPHMKEFVRATEYMLSSRPEVERYRDII